MPRVSVIMPVFNGRTYIEESLNSIQNQTFTDWEFIIIHDFGSNDGTEEIVRKYAAKDQRIRLIQTKKRLGIAASLNLGLKLAQGEYIARVDVDDPSEPQRLERQVAFMDEHPEVNLSSCYCLSLTSTKTSLEEVPCDSEELKAAMLFPNEIRHFGVMFQKKFFDANDLQYDPNYIVEDYELWTRALMKGAVFANIPEVLVTHRWGFGNISIAKGKSLEEEARSISARMLNYLGVRADLYAPELLSGWRARPKQFAKKNRTEFIKQGYRLIQEITEKNRNSRYCDEEALKKILLKRWNWIRESCELTFTPYQYQQFANVPSTPVVSVVLPTYCSALDVSRSIDSVQAQTYGDWELLVINDWGSNDGTAEIVQMYTWSDPRIRLIQADTRLGLAESLNLGIRESRGKYIARLDADDTAYPERFEKQVALMEARPEVGVCGTWQYHYGKEQNWVHKPAIDAKVQRCRLIFWCDLCHSTLMLRRDVFVQNGLFYDPNALAEDFELWTRAIEFMDVVNIPEVLGDYNEGSGITNNKLRPLMGESGKITANAIKRILGIELPAYDYRLLNGWQNPISQTEDREQDLSRLKEILTQIYKRNLDVCFFDSQQLLQTLAAKWFWVKDNLDWKTMDYSYVKGVEEAFADKCEIPLWIRYKSFRERNPQFKTRFKKIVKRFVLRPPAEFLRRFAKSLFRECYRDIDRCVEGWTWDRHSKAVREMKSLAGECRQATERSVEKWTWDRYERQKELLEPIVEYIVQSKRIPYISGEKIRVVFLLQIASFWPSMESLYKSCLDDDRFETILVCYDEIVDSSVKTETTKEFLIKNGYQFVDWTEFELDAVNPHIVFLQTPYDGNRRKRFRSVALASKGYRVIYIPYGIEITDTEHARDAQFNNNVVKYAWKIYLLSDKIRKEYVHYCDNTLALKALGLPRFDALYHPKLELDEAIKQQSKGRKIILWKVHFPKVIWDNGERVLVTPEIREYIKFAQQLGKYSDFFFIFMPHPRFYEFNDSPKVKDMIRQLMQELALHDNVYIDTEDDYRPSLVHADYIIVDRSAVMVEAGALSVPVLYMCNERYHETLTEAVEPLINSYYQGSSCEDMVDFIEMCRRGEDPQREQRQKMFQECIPYFDGKCAERVKEDIVESIRKESSNPLQ